MPWRFASIGLRQQPQAPEACVALAADHQVIVDRNAECLCRRLDLAGHLDAVARRLRVTTGVIVQQATALGTALS
jgi:hypothetical protein